MDKISSFINFLYNSEYSKKITYIKKFPQKNGEVFPIPSFLKEEIKKYLLKKNILKLYAHQINGLNALQEGKNIIINTSTGSGKTFIYNLFIWNQMLDNPELKALYIFPTKSLSQDQLKNLREFPCFKSEIYDGDTPENIRKYIKEKFPSFILSNPDMLHIGILPFHHKWRNFFSKLKFVIIDEVHVYKGIFGSQVSHIIRRLRRICDYYKSSPIFILSSATINEPEKFAKDFTGLDFVTITGDKFPSGERTFLFWNADIESPYSQTLFLLMESLKFGLSTIIFTKSRKTTELLQMWILEKKPVLSQMVSSYRAGYLPEERRKIEKTLFEGKLKGVISTSALELGIDIGTLDCCILFGYPGSITSTWQRIGRVGRGKKDSIVIFIGLQDTLDQYFIRHPQEFFKRSCENVIINFENEIISTSHLKCASVEIPITKKDCLFYGDFILKLLERDFFKPKNREEYHYIGKPIHNQINLRSIGEIFSLIDKNTGDIIGEIEENKVFFECFPGSIYLHLGKKYEVLYIDIEKKLVFIQKVKVNYYTQPNWWEKIEILMEKQQKSLGYFIIKYGDIEVTTQVTSYEKRSEKDRTLISFHQLSLPSQKFKTQSFWIEIPENLQDEFKRKNMDFNGSMHATEHSIIGIFPLEVTCDRWDIGGYSFPFHYQTKKPTIFIYDAYPGGIGITEKGFEKFIFIIKSAIEVVESCKCEMGCPSCIQSPKCGNNNKPLDKKGALFLLKYTINDF